MEIHLMLHEMMTKKEKHGHPHTLLKNEWFVYPKPIQFTTSRASHQHQNKEEEADRQRDTEISIVRGNKGKKETNNFSPFTSTVWLSSFSSQLFLVKSWKKKRGRVGGMGGTNTRSKLPGIYSALLRLLNLNSSLVFPLKSEGLQVTTSNIPSSSFLCSVYHNFSFPCFLGSFVSS